MNTKEDLKTCYTCLQNFTSLIDPLEKDEDNISYIFKLANVLKVSLITEGIGICADCIDQLRVSYKFLETVSVSQEYWKRNSKEITLKFEEVIEPDDNLIINNKDDIKVKTEKIKLNSLNEICNIDVEDDNYDSVSLVDEEVKDVKNYICTKCSKEFSEETFSNHDCCKAQQTNQIKSTKKGCMDVEIFYECKLCNKLFSEKWRLSKHMANMHDIKKGKVQDDKDTFECTNCSKAFRDFTDEEFLSHSCFKDEERKEKKPVKSSRKTGVARKKLEKDRHKCTFCDKIFRAEIPLKEHLTLHTGEKNFACDICGEEFRLYSCRHRHKKTHFALPGQKTKKTPFLCTICGKNFPYSNSYQRHMRVHLGIRNHECKICYKRFRVSTHLKVHMRTHTGEKPYVCDVCGTAFSLKPSLDNHIQKIHNAEPSRFKFMCSLCGQNFKKNVDLQSHVYSIHNSSKHINNPVTQDMEPVIKKSIYKHRAHQTDLFDRNFNYTCFFCGECFTKLVDYHVHIKVHHDQEDAKNSNTEDINKDDEVSTPKPNHNKHIGKAKKNLPCSSGRYFTKNVDSQAHSSRAHTSGESSKNSNSNDLSDRKKSPRKISRNMPTLLL